jgi:hypothetical protein
VGGAGAMPEPFAFGVVLMGGTSTTVTCSGRRRVSTSPVGRVEPRVVGSGGCLGTLLGPEGTAPRGEVAS